MHQVERAIHVGHGLSHRRGIFGIALKHLDPVGPAAFAEAVGVPGDHPDLVAVVEELGDEPTADVSGRAGHEQAHSFSVAQVGRRRIRSGTGGLGWVNQEDRAAFL